MLAALGEARAETEATLTRQREFVADASHELRTPLTSVLANLELLEEYARRRAARGRRLRAALLAPDAPAGRRPAAARARRRRPRHRRTSRSTSPRSSPTRPPSSSRSPATTRSRSRRRPAMVVRRRARRAAPPDPQPDGERAAPHRPGHGGRGAGRRARTARCVLAVEDDGPGIPDELHDKVFERFFRGSSDRGGSSGLGPLDRPRRRGVPPRHRRARAAARRPRRALRGAPAGAASRSPEPSGRTPAVGLTRLKTGPARSIQRATSVQEPATMPDTTPKQLVVFSLGSEEYALPIGVGARDHPLHRAALGRLRGAVDPRRDRPARQDHPDLRPRRPHGRRARPTPSRGKIVIVESGAAPGRRDRRRGRRGADRRAPTSSRTSRPPTRESIEAIAKIGDRLVVLLNADGPVRPRAPPRSSPPA